MKKLTVLAALALSAVLPTAHAAEGSFCKVVPSVSLHRFAGPEDSHVFICGNGLKLTVPQLYAAGWRVVSVNYTVRDPIDLQLLVTILIEKP